MARADAARGEGRDWPGRQIMGKEAPSIPPAFYFAPHTGASRGRGSTYGVQFCTRDSLYEPPIYHLYDSLHIVLW